MSSRKIKGYEQDSAYYDFSEPSEYTYELANKNYFFELVELKSTILSTSIMIIENVVALKKK